VKHCSDDHQDDCRDSMRDEKHEPPALHSGAGAAYTVTLTTSRVFARVVGH
jgi:hypothetical protein